MYKFYEKWRGIVINGDPYYNSQLTLKRADLSLRNVFEEKIGEPFPLDDLFYEIKKQEEK